MATKYSLLPVCVVLVLCVERTTIYTLHQSDVRVPIIIKINNYIIHPKSPAHIPFYGITSHLKQVELHSITPMYIQK